MKDPIYTLADSVISELRATCQRIELAGSCRRGKADPSDIEIVCIPDFAYATAISFLSPVPQVVASYSRLDASLARMVAGREWEYDPRLRRNGEAYKRLSHTRLTNSKGHRLALDVFITTPDKWGVIFAFRTGPAEFAHGLNLRAEAMGYHIHGGRIHLHPKQNGKPCPQGEVCHRLAKTKEEADVFACLNLANLPPGQRRWA